MSLSYVLGCSSQLTDRGAHADSSVSQAVIVLKSLIQAAESSEGPTSFGKEDTEKLVSKLVRQLDGISNPSARACVFWLAGQYATRQGGAETSGTFGGLAPWAPDTLRKGVKDFMNEVC